MSRDGEERMLKKVRFEDAIRLVHLIAYDERERQLVIRRADDGSLPADTVVWLTAQRFSPHDGRSFVRRTGPRMFPVIVGRLSEMMSESGIWDAGTVSGAMFTWSGADPPSIPDAWIGRAIVRICQTDYALIIDRTTDMDEVVELARDIYSHELFPNRPHDT